MSSARESALRAALPAGVVAKLDTLMARARRLRGFERGLVHQLHELENTRDQARHDLEPEASPEVVQRLERLDAELGRVTDEHAEAAGKFHDAARLYEVCTQHVGLTAELIR